MKPNHVHHRHNYLKILAPVFAVMAVVVALALGYRKLRSLYLEQAEIADYHAQVKIETGKMVRSAVLAEMFGLKKGANLATLDFAAKRKEILRRIPTLREIYITRALPGKVTIRAEERVPIVRLGIKGQRTETGRVADEEGVVFLCQRGTQMLPIIREVRAPGTALGQRLSARAAAALRLVQAVREPEFSDLGLLEIDLSRQDFLLLTLGNYSKVKICWEGMDAELEPGETPSEEQTADMLARLRNLLKAMRSRISSDTRIWNATLPDRVFADNQERK